MERLGFSAIFRYGSLLAIVLAFAISSATAQRRNIITGYVFSPDRRPVAQAPVEVINEVNQVVGRTRTDGSGRYTLAGLSAGRYVVRVLPLGTNLEEQTQEVEIVNIARPGGVSSDQVFKDFYLQARRTDTAAAGKAESVFAQDVPDQAKRLYEKGVAELDNGQRENGIRTLLAAAEMFPEYYEVLELLGREYLMQENFQYARAVFTKMVSVNDRSFTGWLGLGFTACALGESAVAVEAARKAITLQPDSYDAFLVLGRAFRQAGDFVEAEKALLKAGKLSNGTSADVHWNLALLYGNNLNRFTEAANELESYLRTNPKAPNAADVRKLIDRFKEKARQRPR